MSDVLIRAEGVSKKFCRTLRRSLWYGVKDTFRDLAVVGARPDLRRGEFWAVDDVSFEVRRGECLGLIGRNGAGKTTVLKMLNGLIKPDKGRIEMRGRIGALIALGAGFNPILTGRENVYIYGSVLGLSKKEIDRKFDEIIDFAEVSDFIDTPVQSYSSGMQVRLGFAVATALQPDILLVDEVLAVGDVRFRWKCLERIKRLKESGVSIILVSHRSDDLMRTCTNGLVLEAGKTTFDGGHRGGSPRLRASVETWRLAHADARRRRDKPRPYIGNKLPRRRIAGDDDAQWGCARCRDRSRIPGEDRSGAHLLRSVPFGDRHALRRFVLRLARVDSDP